MRHKVLFISSWFPNKLEPINGSFVQRHAEAVANFHDVEILHVIGDFQQKKKFVLDEQTVNGIKTLIVYYRNTNNPMKNFSNRMKAYQLGFQKLQKPDIVHGNILLNNMFFALWLKKKFGIPFVITEHFTDFRKINYRNLNIQRKITARIIGNQAEMIFPVSTDLMNGLRNLGINTKMKVIPNVVDINLFRPADYKHNTFTFVHISNLSDRKNPQIILDAAIQLLKKGYQFQMKMGGGGTPEIFKKLKDTAENSGFMEHFDFFGLQNSAGVAEIMRASDCFILFSEDENQPCVISEAFASGIRVISANVGGIAEFFPENFGFLIPLESNALVTAMEKIILQKSVISPSEIANYAEQNFSFETIGKRYSNAYKKVLNDKLH